MKNLFMLFALFSMAYAIRGEAAPASTSLYQTWLPYSDGTQQRSGSLTITKEKLIFSKGYSFSYHNEGDFVLVSAPEGNKKALTKKICDEAMPLSATLEVTPNSEIGTKLTLIFYSTNEGPKPDRDFALNRCYSAVYVAHHE